MPLRIMIVEDNKLIRMSLSMAIQRMHDTQIIAETDDGRIAVTEALALKPDLIIMDIGIASLSGIEATREIKESLPEVKVIVLTAHDDSEAVHESKAAGASGFCSKDISSEELYRAIQRVAAGGQWPLAYERNAD